GNEPSPEPEPDPLQAAMKYRLDSDKILGELGDVELKTMLDKINALNPPSRKMRTIKAHIETLLAYLASVAQTDAEVEEEPAAKTEEGSTDNDGNWSPQVIQALINAGLTENTFSALGMLKRLDLTPANTEETIIECATKYRESRDADGTVDDAAAIANTWLADWRMTEAVEEVAEEKQEELPF
ncbi:MAG TPA: hypothetical protein VM223_13780, partial [Planctomycetota bacterium]|nr:hypothetical protein [Planctomycetota bacterium]